VRPWILLPLVVACQPPCIQPGYARDARGTSEYQLVTIMNGARSEQRGFGPERLSMHLYDPFECNPHETPKNFWIELGPSCRLMARAESQAVDTGRSSIGGKFIQAEASLFAGHTCTLALDGGRRIEGRVKSGLMVIGPATMMLDLALDVPGGTFHLVQNGAWNERN
jgi:hypothetical protein